ncbi:hypothetical protein ACVOMV_24990 [Mesorhizobium atlanticum]
MTDNSKQAWVDAVAAGETTDSFADWWAEREREEQCDDWPSCACGQGGPDNCRTDHFEKLVDAHDRHRVEAHGARVADFRKLKAEGKI